MDLIHTSIGGWLCGYKSLNSSQKKKRRNYILY